jgi:hypothetical protein
MKEEKERNVQVGGDFANIFDAKDYLAMLNTSDQAACVLRGHMVLEEFVDLWANKVTDCDDLFGGIFVPFKTKLVMGKNLGMSEEIFKVLDKVNDIRNRFGHRRGYELDQQTIDALKNRVNTISGPENINNCEDFHLFRSGIAPDGQRREISHTYHEGDDRMKFVIIFVILMLKLCWWMQSEFQQRGIKYTIIARVDG